MIDYERTRRVYEETLNRLAEGRPTPSPATDRRGIVCRSTRYGAGCGHPVNAHDGNPARECCCCNRRHNDPDHARDCIHCHARRIKAQLGGTPSMGEIAPHMPEHLVQPFWEWAVDRYLTTELAALSTPPDTEETT